MAGELEREVKNGKIALHWTVKLSSLGDGVGRCIDSRIVGFWCRLWGLTLYPNGIILNGSEGYMLLDLCVCDLEPIRVVRYSVGIRKAEGGMEVRASGTEIFEHPPFHNVRVVVMKRSELLRRAKELLPRDTLTLTVTLELDDGSSETGLEEASVQAAVERNVADVSVQATVERTVADASVQATVERKVADVSVQTAVEESEACGGKGEPSERTGPEKIVEDVGNLWPNGDHTDVILKVRDVEFRAHRTILAARTPVLGAMFHHDTEEKASGEVSIEDCEPEVFEQLLHFIYRGAPRELTAENACALYVVADKYLVDEVKALCVRCMRDTLCLDSFCDTLTLSLMHGEDDLLKTATDFLSENMIDVMRSVEWQRFMIEHPIWANEILIRATQLTAARYEKEKKHV